MSAFFTSIIFFSACRIAYPALFLLRRDMRLVQLLIILPTLTCDVLTCVYIYDLGVLTIFKLCLCLWKKGKPTLPKHCDQIIEILVYQKIWKNIVET